MIKRPKKTDDKLLGNSIYDNSLKDISGGISGYWEDDPPETNPDEDTLK